SREPVVGLVVPAFLTLIGGLALFEAGRRREQQFQLAMVVAVISVNLLLATTWGSTDRELAELKFKRWTEDDRGRLLTRASLTQSEVNEFRKNYGLGPIELSDVMTEGSDA